MVERELSRLVRNSPSYSDSRLPPPSPDFEFSVLGKEKKPRKEATIYGSIIDVHRRRFPWEWGVSMKRERSR